MTRRVTTNTAIPAGLRAPVGQFAHARRIPPVTYRDVLGANADALVFFGLAGSPRNHKFSRFPTPRGRYFMKPMLDGWTDVFQAQAVERPELGKTSFPWFP
jgi:Protein of unknown function (DUF1254)